MTTARVRWLWVLAVCLIVASSATAEEPPPSAPSVAAAAAPAGSADHAAWVGTWTLDEDASDPIEKMLDVMDVSWYVRAVAKAFTPQFEVAEEGRGLAWTSSTPLGTRTQHFRADDVDYPGEDQLERTFVQKSVWAPDGHLLVDRTTTLPSGKKVTVRSDWSLDGSKLVNHLNVTPEDAEPFRLKRVFVRQGS